MSLYYKIAYTIGFTPWENAATHRPAAEQVAALVDREQAERGPPMGQALDPGCGSGYWAIDLAKRATLHRARTSTSVAVMHPSRRLHKTCYEKRRNLTSS
jgi:hypothetical protein